MQKHARYYNGKVLWGCNGVYTPTTPIVRGKLHTLQFGFLGGIALIIAFVIAIIAIALYV